MPPPHRDFLRSQTALVRPYNRKTGRTLCAPTLDEARFVPTSLQKDQPL
jgi:hypothetical protein